MGDEVPRRAGQTDKARMKQLRLLKTNQNAEITDIREREAVRLRDLLGETPEAKVARETKDAAKKAKLKVAADAKAAKKANADEKKAKADEKKAKADEKRAKTAETKAARILKGPKAAAGPSKRQKVASTAGTGQMTLGARA
jgi:hypothetical protein